MQAKFENLQRALRILTGEHRRNFQRNAPLHSQTLNAGYCSKFRKIFRFVLILPTCGLIPEVLELQCHGKIFPADGADDCL